MSTQNADQEPSMEEILSSIRRIIADDDDEAAPAKPAATAPSKARKPEAGPPAPAVDDEGADDDVLDLTQVVQPGRDTGKRELFAASKPFDSEMDEIELEPEEAYGAEDQPAPPRGGKPPPAKAAVDPSREDDTLISAAAADRSTGALAKLARAAAHREAAPLAHGDRTVEAFLAELLRPMLKEWLDTHLETVVERVVEQEVKKLAKRAELR
jgi:uncharacterized protein